MGHLFDALWQGVVTGSSTRTRDAASVPQSVTGGGSLTEALFWFGFETANVVVYGARH